MECQDINARAKLVDSDECGQVRGSQPQDPPLQKPQGLGHPWRELRPALDISLAFAARERFSKVRGAAHLGDNPRAQGPRGIVAHVLTVAALEIGDPIAEIVLVESYDLALR